MGVMTGNTAGADKDVSAKKLGEQLREKDAKLSEVLASHAALDAELQKLRDEVAAASAAPFSSARRAASSSAVRARSTCLTATPCSLSSERACLA